MKLSESGPVTVLENDGMGMVYSVDVTDEVRKLEAVVEERHRLRLALSLAFKLEPQLTLHTELRKFVLDDPDD